MKSLLIALLASTLSCGYAHRFDTDTQIAETATPILPPQAQTVDWGHSGRAGAAERQSGWVHVLAEKSLNHDLDQRDHPPVLVRSEPVSTPDTAAQRGYSHYELQRWRRYCNSGKGMDRRDREFVRQESYQVPAVMRSHCQPPSIP